MDKINVEKITPVSIQKAESAANEAKPTQTEVQNQTDLGVLNNYKRDLVKPASVGTAADESQANPLDKFVLPKVMRTFNSHSMYCFMNRNVSSVHARLSVRGPYWAQTPMKTEGTTPWKMHIYADTEEDWAKLVSTVGRYLNTQKVDWKTLSSVYSVDDLNKSQKQKGKAFTVYTTDKEQFKQLAKDIDYIIKLNGLETEDSNIIGDRQLGSTGRIFYRYDHKSGESKDKVFHYDNDEEMKEYEENYEPNRGNDSYLAEDMTTADDPFYNLDI